MEKMGTDDIDKKKISQVYGVNIKKNFQRKYKKNEIISLCVQRGR